ncbi:MAG TPA: hypothetical protein VFK88_04830, partial [Gallionella sp.]|nr:hypothetical protein [Gallionella sp.]
AGARLVAAAGLLLALAGLHPAPAVAQEAGEAPKYGNAESWNLTSATVVDKGQTSNIEGKLVQNFTLEAKATATNQADSLVPAGTFRLVMSAFSPASDQRGQKKGVWYVHGKWTLTDEKAPAAGHAGPQAGVISGQINAELPFNPIATPKDWVGKIRLPIARIVPVGQTGTMQLSRGGEGTLALDSKREGKLSLNLRLQPVMLNPEGVR